MDEEQKVMTGATTTTGRGSGTTTSSARPADAIRCAASGIWWLTGRGDLVGELVQLPLAAPLLVAVLFDLLGEQ
ncbi:hypothetical protein [Streptomyces aureus]|uniref:hypothetical protein n=1 Tax=Streptomyces aureus TaxID=193461 RepID=UPI00368E1804